MKNISNKEWQHRQYANLEKMVLSMGNKGSSEMIIREHCFFLLSLYRDCLADMEGQLSFKIMDDIASQISRLESLVF